MKQDATIGFSQRRIDGREKVTGDARYAGDVALAGMTYAKLVLSSAPAGRIVAYHLDEAARAPGVIAVLCGRDLPTVPGADVDQPLAVADVRYAGQPVAVVVADSEAAAADAAELVYIDLEPIEPLLDVRAAASAERSVLGVRPPIPAGLRRIVPVMPTQEAELPPNVAGRVSVRAGDVEGALASAHHRVSGTWTIPMAHQAPLEPHVAVARAEQGTVTVWTSTQGASPAQSAVAAALKLPRESIRIVPMTMGGGFGGKGRPLLEQLVALLAVRIGRPVRLALTRTEEFQMGRQGVGAVFVLDVGADAGGHLVGLRATSWWDGGTTFRGYAGLASMLTCNSYRIPNYEFNGYDVNTNKPPVSPYRAPNAPPVYFALESAIDELAEKCGIDPVTFRLQNAVREDDHRIGGCWPRLGLVECLEVARTHPVYVDPLGQDEAVGVAIGLWPAAWGPAAALCSVDPDGGVTLSIGYVDITGTDTAMAMLAAETLGVGVDRVRIDSTNAAVAPFPGASGGSKTLYSVGPAVLEAAADARNQILAIAAEHLEAAPEDMTIEGGRVIVVGAPARSLTLAEVAAFSRESRGSDRPLLGQGRTVPQGESPLSTVHVCRLRLDRETGMWVVLRYLAVQDVGHAINPAAIEGQLHGGSLQSVGRAYGEEMRWSEAGILVTSTFLDYEIPSIDQDLHIETVLVEVPSPLGPLGARGAGEPSAIPGPAAVANALRRLTGRRFEDLPIRPGRVFQ